MRTAIVVALATLSAPALADTTAAGDPIASHTIALEDATKGLKGAGPLMAKIDVEQSGKTLGAFTCELFDKQAPKTVANFVGLARGMRPWKDPKTGEWVKKPMYDGTIFHRVIPEFMIQGGDPTGTGREGPGYEIIDEIRSELRFDRPGRLAMANRGPNSNGSQFFITEKEAPWLDGKFTIFGQCDGLDLIKRVARVPRTATDRPMSEVKIVFVKIKSAR